MLSFKHSTITRLASVLRIFENRIHGFNTDLYKCFCLCTIGAGFDPNRASTTPMNWDEPAAMTRSCVDTRHFAFAPDRSNSSRAASPSPKNKLNGYASRLEKFLSRREMCSLSTRRSRYASISSFWGLYFSLCFCCYLWVPVFRLTVPLALCAVDGTNASVTPSPVLFIPFRWNQTPPIVLAIHSMLTFR